MLPSKSRQIIVLLEKNLRLFMGGKEHIKILIFPLITSFLFFIGSLRDSSIAMWLGLKLIPLTILGLTRTITFQLVEEKTSKQMELQKIMGVRYFSYHIGWFITHLAKTLLVVVVFEASLFFIFFVYPANISDFKQQYHWWSNVAFLLYGIAQLSLSYLMSPFFQTPKTAADMSTLIIILGDFLTLMAFLFNTLTFESNQVYVQFIYVASTLFPSANIIYILYSGQISLRGSNGEPLSTVLNSFIALGLQSIIYFILFFYFEQITKNEIGIQRDLCFCLRRRKRDRPGRHQIDLAFPLNEVDDHSQPEDDQSSAVYHQSLTQGYHRSIEIKSLTKLYGQLKAVDNLSLSVYESQLLCLLGHNGAGKTTTINLLTGLTKKDEGVIRIYGKSIDEDMDYIRQQTGICLQQDVLYGDLTVEDHLRYYGKIKGVVGVDLENSMIEVLSKCLLIEDREKYASKLSGGGKRRLSLCIALIGRSKVLFLDEPTSGLDPVSRREIWDILLQLKTEQRTMILTTHHLDEAEQISDRVAIMARGKLLTVGTADYIKRNFGVGFNLRVFYQVLNNETQSKKQNIQKLILSSVKDCRLCDTNQDDLEVYIIPFQDKRNLLPLLTRLEQDNEIKIDLAMNSLEETFINIGVDEEQFMQQQLNGGRSRPSIHQLEQVHQPESISIPPTYSFWNQFSANFYRKFYILKSNKRVFLQIVIPLLLIFIDGLSCYQIQLKNKNDVIYSTIVMLLYLTVGLCISVSSAISQLVSERQTQQKFLLNANGCRIQPYWLSSYVFDTLLHQALMVILILFFLITGQFALLKPGMIAIYLSLQPAFLGPAYIMSHFYEDAGTAAKSSFLFILIWNLMLPISIFLVIPQEVSLYFVVFISPLVCFFIGMNTSEENGYPILLQQRVFFIFVLWFQGFIGMLITIVIDKNNMEKKQSHNNQQQFYRIEDFDVQSEAQRVTSLDNQDPIKCINLSKQYEYTNHPAVSNVTFGIEKNTVFGLLGPSGCGKTSIFNSLTTIIDPTCGDVRLLGQNPVRTQSDLYQNIGICTQQDILYETLTPEQHLRLYAQIKGLKGEQLKEVVQYFLQITQLDKYASISSAHLSGGNKRKLCLAIAMLVRPQIQFFDEPTTGVDPISRRFLWNTLRQGQSISNSSILLTTHSIDEAENICNKVGILINGSFVCIGSPQYLKNKYGSGYRANLELRENQQHNVDNLVRQYFPNCKILQQHNKQIYQFELPSDNFSFTNVFNILLQTFQDKLKVITDFSIVQCSLEQVFLYFARFQLQDIRAQNL